MQSKGPNQLNVAKRINLPKAINAAKVLSSYYWSKFTKKPLMWGQPIAMSIEPTTACNLGCPECPSGLKQFSRPEGNIKLDFYKSIIDQQYRTLSYLTFYFQGEPFIHPRFLEMVKYASDKGIYTATSTNAHFINEEKATQIIQSGLNRLIVSVDGTTQEVYENYRINGSLEKVKEGIKCIVDQRNRARASHLEIIIQFLVVKPNEHQIEDVKSLGKELGVNKVVLKTAQVYNYKHGNDLIPTNEMYARYRQKEDGTYEVKNSLLNQCWRMWNSCVVTWDGKVVPCCFDKDAKHQLGELSKDSFKTIWASRSYNRFRGAVLHSRSSIDICTNCTEGTKVWS